MTNRYFRSEGNIVNWFMDNYNMDYLSALDLFQIFPEQAIKIYKQRSLKTKTIINNMKITIVNREEVSFEGKDGVEITGFMYTAFAPKQAMRFWSKNGEHNTHSDIIGYDNTKVEDVNIKVSVDSVTGKTKYSEVMPS